MRSLLTTSSASSLQIFLASAQPHASCAIFDIKVSLGWFLPKRVGRIIDDIPIKGPAERAIFDIKVSLGWFLPKRVGRIIDDIPIKGPAERANLILEDDKVQSLVIQYT